MTLPSLCEYHRILYAAKARKIRRRFRHPGAGRKALAAEAETVRKQCPGCMTA